MFAHISIGVKNIEKSVGFYDSVMEALGYSRLFGDVSEGFMAYGPEECFLVICEPLDETQPVNACNGSHICFEAQSKEAVDNFYKVALEKGAKDGGAPGLRKEYSPNYYAAFIFDIDGHKIEAVANI